MRPSLPVLLPLLLTTFFAIAHAENDAPTAPSPSLDSATSPPPPPPLPWAPESPPPPPPSEWTPMSPPPPPPPAWTPVSPSPPPPPASTPVSSPPPPPPASTPVSSPPPPSLTWTPVANVNVPSIQQVGQFAVRIHALHQGVDMVYVNVVSGQTQPSKGGCIYQLVISVTGSGAKSPRYDAVVWGILGTTSWELLSFKPAK